jgi:arabinogalactan endo-1,4-beta-galactosidase
MKNHFPILVLLAALFMACGGHDPVDPGTDTIPSVPTPTFAKGADISWVSEMESAGKKFKKRDGSQADIFDVLKEVGINSIRLRVWVDPTGGWSGKADVVKLATRAAKAGMALMIDFHYSDFFADPGRQDIPKAWAADKNDLDKMAKHVSDHTTDILTALKEAGVTPAWVQVGNETRNGMLWPTGQLWTSTGDIPNGRANFARLLTAGYDAVKAVFPKAVVLAHLNNAYEDNAWWFEQVKGAGGKFDAIALSHYPQAEKAQTPAQYNALAVSRIRALISKFNVPVIVSEVGVKTPADESAAAQALSEFMTDIQKISRCDGVFYWEPEVYGGWKPAIYNSLGWGAYGMGAFTSEGKASSVMDAFR